MKSSNWLENPASQAWPRTTHAHCYTFQFCTARIQTMSQERFLERQRDVRDSAARLAEAVAQPESELIRDATIQRFEFTFQTLTWD